jgi:hypothetical protein
MVEVERVECGLPPHCGGFVSTTINDAPDSTSDFQLKKVLVPWVNL